MYAGVSSAPWKPSGSIGNNKNGSKTTKL